MVTTGYPDFSRLTAGTGTEISVTTATYTTYTTVFTKFVGSWPYLNVWIQPNKDTGLYYQFEFDYYTDSTLSASTGSQTFGTSPIGYLAKQLTPLGPWCVASITEFSTGTAVPLTISVYGSYGQAKPRQLFPAYLPLISGEQAIAAGASVTLYPNFTVSGDAVLNLSTAVGDWTLDAQYYDAAAGTWNIYWRAASALSGSGGTWDVPVLDTPCRIDLSNLSTSTVNYWVSWILRLPWSWLLLTPSCQGGRVDRKLHGRSGSR